MKVIIVGLGQTGTLLADMISRENHDVVVLDANKEKVDAVTSKYNVSGVVGSGASKECLVKAGADTADVVVALTPIDEINLLICMVAKNCGTRYVVAKMNQQELSGEQRYYTKEFQIDCIINAKEITAKEIARHIGLPGAVRADGFFGNSATVLRLNVEQNALLVDKNMREVRQLFDMDVLVGTVVRDGKVIVPNGDITLQQGDSIDLIVPNESILAVLMKLNVVRKEVKRVMIAGGGDVAAYLIQGLLKEKKKITVLDSDAKRCMYLSTTYPEINVACTEEIDADVLLEEGIEQADVCVSLTGQDDTNLVISLFAWSCGIKSVITKVNSPAYENLLNKVSIDITISPSVICATKILGFIRDVVVYNHAGRDIRSVCQIAGGLGEAIEFIAYDNFKKLNIAFMAPEFKLKKDTLIGAILRNGEAIIPSGTTSIVEGDHVVVVTKRNSGYNVLNDILTK